MNLSRLIQVFKTVTNLYLSQIGIRRLPFSLFWYITWRCNSKCLQCKFGISGEDTTIRMLKQEEVSLSRVKEIISEARRWGARHIAFAGGEPFVREDFLDIVRHCKKEGYVVGVSTNGFLLSNLEFAQRVVESGVDRIDISLDSPDSLHDYLRSIPRAFELVDKAIDNLKCLKNKSHFYLGINVVVSGFNLHRLIDIFNYAKRKQIDGVGLQPFHYTQARAKELIPYFLLRKEQIAELKRIMKIIISEYGYLLKNSFFFAKNIPTFYENNKMPGFRCYGGLQEIHLFPDGTIGVCCFNYGRESVKNKSLKEILFSDEFKAILKKAKNKECPGCWSPPVHEYNILFKLNEFMSGLRLTKTFLKWTKD